jgi:hypothetical protein
MSASNPCAGIADDRLRVEPETATVTVPPAVVRDSVKNARRTDVPLVVEDPLAGTVVDGDEVVDDPAVVVVVGVGPTAGWVVPPVDDVLPPATLAARSSAETGTAARSLTSCPA